MVKTQCTSIINVSHRDVHLYLTMRFAFSLHDQRLIKWTLNQSVAIASLISLWNYPHRCYHHQTINCSRMSVFLDKLAVVKVVLERIYCSQPSIMTEIISCLIDYSLFGRKSIYPSILRNFENFQLNKVITDDNRRKRCGQGGGEDAIMSPILD